MDVYAERNEWKKKEKEDEIWNFRWMSTEWYSKFNLKKKRFFFEFKYNQYDILIAADVQYIIIYSMQMNNLKNNEE